MTISTSTACMSTTLWITSYACCLHGRLAVVVEHLVYATRRGYVEDVCSGCEQGVDVLAT